MSISDCGRCGFIYNSFEGDPKNGVPPFTDLRDLTGTLCSMCGMSPEGRDFRPSKAYQGLEAEVYYLFSGRSSPLSYGFKELEGKKILDVGAGCGRVGLPFLDWGVEVTLLEKSPAMLEQIPLDDSDKLRILEGDVLDLSFEQDFYDGILLTDAFLQHFPEKEQEKILQKLFLALKPAGKLVVEVFLPRSMQVSVDKYKERDCHFQYFHQTKAELDLLSKEIKMEIFIQECQDSEVKRQARFLRYLHLILPQDLERIFERMGVPLTSLNWENVSRTGSKGENLLPSSGRNPLIQKDWIQGGYPFSTSDSQAVTWLRLSIEK